MIPTLIVPFWTIRPEYFVLRTLPRFASLNPAILVKRNRLNLLRLRLCTEVRVLRFDLLHLLWFWLFRLGSRRSLRGLLAGWRSWSWPSWRRLRTRRRRRWRSRCLCRSRALHAFPPLLSLLLRTRRGRAGLLTGHTSFLRGRSCRLLSRWSCSAFSCTGFSRSCAFIRRSAALYCSGLLCGGSRGLCRIRLRLLCFSRACFWRGPFALCW